MIWKSFHWFFSLALTLTSRDHVFNQVRIKTQVKCLERQFNCFWFKCTLNSPCSIKYINLQPSWYFQKHFHKREIPEVWLGSTHCVSFECMHVNYLGDENSTRWLSFLQYSLKLTQTSPFTPFGKHLRDADFWQLLTGSGYLQRSHRAMTFSSSLWRPDFTYSV